MPSQPTKPRPHRTSGPSALSRRRALGLAAALIVFVVTRLLILSMPPASSDVVKYHGKAFQAASGAVAYRDIPIEYPPLSWWMIRAAYSDSADPRRSDVTSAFSIYRDRFRALSCALEVLAFALLLLSAHLIRPDRTVWLAWTYVTGSSLLAYVIYDRLDTALLLLFMAWLATSAMAGRDARRAELWSHAAYVLLGLGAALKVIPILCLPLLLVAEFSASAKAHRLLSRASAFAIATALPFLPHLAEAGLSSLAFLGYHSERGLQVESVAASLMLLLSFAGLEVLAERTHESWTLAGSLASALAWISSLVLALFLTALTLAAARLRKGGIDDQPLLLACLAVLGAAVFSKVLSPQFFVWLLPLTLLLAAAVASRRELLWTTPALLLTLALSLWLFPGNYFSHNPPSAFFSGAAAVHNPHGLIPQLNPLPKAILVLRNAILTAVIALLGYRTIARQRLGAVDRA